MTTAIPKALISKAAMQAGLTRSVAQVFAEIAYWDQIEGGRQIKGRRMRWRTSREIGEQIGYGERTVTRAIAALRAEALIESQVIWSPTKNGTRVNAFALLPRGAAMLEAVERPKLPPRKRGLGRGNAENLTPSGVTQSPSRERHIGRIKYSQQDQETRNELVTLPSAGERLFTVLRMEELQGEKLVEWFIEYLTSGTSPANASPYAFWAGLAVAMDELKGQRIEAWTDEVGRRVSKFLANFESTKTAQFTMYDAAAVAVWAMCNPSSAGDCIKEATGREPSGSGIGSFQLGVNGHALANRLQWAIQWERAEIEGARAADEFLGRGLH